jgi:hypothetical protein
MPIAFPHPTGGKAMVNLKIASFAILMAVVSVIAGCGGEGSGGSELLPAKILSWNPPVTYQDGSSLDPAADLDSYEIYVKETPNFSDTDNEMAALSATDKASGQVCTSFNLANLSPFISKGVTYHVCTRAVAKTGLKSGFSPSATFSF